MKVYTNSDTFGSISLKLLVCDGKVFKVIKNCTVGNGQNSDKKCKKCVYSQICSSLSELTKNFVVEG